MNFHFSKIHILGASGSGTTTLAASLCQKIGYSHFDSDDYFWKTKYSEPRNRKERLNLLSNELCTKEKWILSGAVIDWGNPLVPLFDLIVFLSVPNSIRIKRLKTREFSRYGDKLYSNEKKQNEFEKFIEWASKYETGGMEVRSRYQQEKWLEDIKCPVLKISGSDSIFQNTKKVLNYLQDKIIPIHEC